MLPKLIYKKLLKLVDSEVQNQIKDYGEVSISTGLFWRHPFEHQGRIIYLELKQIDEALPQIAKTLGLVDDLTGRKTWTKPGHAPSGLAFLQAYARKKREV